MLGERVRTFSESRRCPKCAFTDLFTNWCPGIRAAEKGASFGGSSFGSVLTPPICREIIQRNGPDNSPTYKDLVDEHIHRRCNRCKYSWAEIPLDLAPALEQLARQAE